MNKIWTYKGKDYSFDITEESCYSLVERGLGELSLSIDGEKEEGFANGCCESIRRFFDTVFGEGVGVVICGRKKSADSHISAYVSFISFLCEQVDQFSRLRAVLEV